MTDSVKQQRTPCYWRADRIKPTDEQLDVEVAIYGGNAAGVTAAIRAVQSGRRVALVHPGWHLGGMTSAGLSWTDVGDPAVVGGLSRAFYQRLGAYDAQTDRWLFEPHAAERLLHELVAEHEIPIRFGQFLADAYREGDRITAIRMTSGLVVRARMFIDTSYEGNLMAAAGVRYTVGREANSAYGETLNGVQVHDKHQFEHPVDPYVVEGDAGSGLLSGVEPAEPGPTGMGDRRIQAYCFRMCLCDDPSNRVAFAKPADYQRQEYELLARYFETGWREVFRKFDRITPTKTDTNNSGAVSTDFIGRNYAWPEASYAERERIFQHHLSYQQGLFWFLCNDPAVPKAIREQMNTWGLAADEFAATGHWPQELYIREARRMVSDVVLTERECMGLATVDESVGMGSYTLDSHNCCRFVRMDSGRARVLNEGDVQIRPPGPYAISYRSIVPRRGDCTNLLVPVCLSASHIAYGSVRMEPVFMVLAESAATAADLALSEGQAVQDIEYPALRRRLLAQGQVLELAPAAPPEAK